MRTPEMSCLVKPSPVHFLKSRRWLVCCRKNTLNQLAGGSAISRGAQESSLKLEEPNESLKASR